MANKCITSEQARRLLCIQDPIEVAWTSRDGTLRDDDGDPIDERQTVPWVMKLGPFGSWPSTVEDAEKDFIEHANKDWWLGESFRIGTAVVWKTGWGYAAYLEVPAELKPHVVE